MPCMDGMGIEHGDSHCSVAASDLLVYQSVTDAITSFIGKMLVPLGWYPSCLTPQGAL